MPQTGQVLRGLGGPQGFGETALARGDDDSFQLDLSAVFDAGFHIFGRSHAGTALWVNTNGALSFGGPLDGYRTETTGPLAQDVIAPFWADVDTRIDGEGAESGQIWVDIDSALDRVTITWDSVGSYRRQADDTNLFQVTLTDRGGGDFDISFRYERIEWTYGTAEGDAGASAQIAGLRLPLPLLIGSDPALLHESLGNTGQAGTWQFEMRDGALPGAVPVTGAVLEGGATGDVLTGGAGNDLLRGRDGPDILRGHDGHDWLFGGDGGDTLNGGDGNDVIYGGTTDADISDVIYGGNGHDRIYGGAGNDIVYGGNDNDSIEGGAGADELLGQLGDDVITGSAWSDLIYGGEGNDFINGGFGSDRVNGGTGADRFYHLGIPDHGSDWIQDYTSTEGDSLLWGGGPDSPQNFQVNFAETPNAGTSGVAEAFVIYLPTDQIIWALVDGAAQDQINIRIAGNVFDLMG